MKKLFFSLQFPLFVAFNFFAFTAVLQLFNKNTVTETLAANTPGYNGIEEYDPALGRLNSTEKLENYCDSLYQSVYAILPGSEYNVIFPQLVVKTVRKRFYHGYSYFGLNNNFVASMFEPLTGKSLSAIVLPNQILKYPYAACSQQSIIVLEILKRRNIPTRAITFAGKKNGHFCFEIMYNNSWHFFDPDMEPDGKLLDAHNRPAIASLAKDLPLLLAAYKHVPREMVLDIFPHYHYGKLNATLAPRAAIYQKVTGFLSYSIWSFFLVAFIGVRRKYQSLSRRATVKRVKVPAMVNEPVSPYLPA